MLTNNIVNYQNEWPLQEDAFYNYLIGKYGSEEKIFGVHHYETKEVKSSLGVTIVPQGLEVPSTYSVTFYDNGQMKTESLLDTVTNYEYEQRYRMTEEIYFYLKHSF